MRAPVLLLLLVVLLPCCPAQPPPQPGPDDNAIIPSQENIRRPTITDVSAMCAEEGITAQVMFDGAFYGKIYSKDYATVHDCVYYNSYDMNMVLFTIPNTKCGTKIDRTAINIVNRIENEVYVQFDKDTQTEADRRFLFICDRASSSIDSSNQVVTPKDPVVINNDKFKTIEPTRIVVTQNTNGDDTARRDIVMEIQEGRGPYQPAITKPVKLGDLMTLVVKQHKDSSAPSNAFNMFVHSCYAADGTGANKVQLIDEKGCTSRPQVAGRMQRVKAADGATLYYFRISAFKFPGPSDVYFTCSVDVCADCDYQLLCGDEGTTTVGQRQRRFVSGLVNSSRSHQLQLHDYVSIVDQMEAIKEKQRRAYLTEHPEDWAGESTHPPLLCVHWLTVYTFVCLFVCLFLITLGILAYLFHVLGRLARLAAHDTRSGSAGTACSSSAASVSSEHSSGGAYSAGHRILPLPSIRPKSTAAPYR